MGSALKILGVDPGYERIGIAELLKDDRGEKIIRSECFVTSSRDTFPERLRAIGEKMRRVMRKNKPDAVAIETLLFNSNQKTAMSVAAARGVIIYETMRHGCPVFEYTPLQIKIAVAGYGRADKKQVKAMVERLTHLPPKKRMDDEYDAIAVALAHAAGARGLRLIHRSAGFAKEKAI